jgi:hypothetical protein
MSKLAVLALAIAPLGISGCISNPAGPTLPGEDAGLPTEDGATPIGTTDGAVDSGDGSSPSVTDGGDAGDASPPLFVDGGIDAGTYFAGGLGSAIVAHSAHFTLITKTGTGPGGAGLHSSSSFKLVSGATPPGKH